MGYFKKDIHEVGENIEFDAQKLNQKLSAMECMQSENMVEPENAYIDFKANEFVIVEEKEGTVVDKTMLLPLLEDAIHKSETKLSVQDAGAYKTATVKKDDKDLAAKQKMWNDHARATIVYTFGDQVEPVTGMAIKEWLAYDEKGNYVDDPAILRANVENFVRLLAEKYDTVGKERTIVGTATGQEITVTGGSYGYKIDQKAEVEQLLSEITSHANIEREPVYTQTEKTREGNGLGDTYVEIDMTAQHLWFYKNGTIIVESNIVTGTYVVPDRRTPGGTYYLYYKQKDQVLRGKKLEDGTYEYESPVSYWMPFNRGIGLHDASWRYGNFGGSIYMTSGSHGCVNLPPSAAAQIYENIEAGCPIICYYR